MDDLIKIYKKALEATNGEYKGYTNGNALSLWVYENYGINAACNKAAHDALCTVLEGG